MSASATGSIATGPIKHVGSLWDIKIILYELTLFKSDGDDIRVPEDTYLVKYWELYGTA
jgi:hypothetical protein